jgi:hypothetical protein
VVALAESAGLRSLSQEHLSVPTDKGANAGLKVASLVAGMLDGADSTGDMGLHEIIPTFVAGDEV